MLCNIRVINKFEFGQVMDEKRPKSGLTFLDHNSAIF